MKQCTFCGVDHEDSVEECDCCGNKEFKSKFVGDDTNEQH